jgi:hypothetical protein
MAKWQCVGVIVITAQVPQGGQKGRVRWKKRKKKLGKRGGFFKDKTKGLPSMFLNAPFFSSQLYTTFEL